MHKAGRLRNVARRTNMTTQERTVRATRELNNTVRAADVANILRLIRAARKGVGRGGSVSTRKWGGATASQDRTPGAAPASSPAASSVARATCSAIWPCRALATAERRDA
eukprot:556575-Pyramimonas_sp.AAC.1